MIEAGEDRMNDFAPYSPEELQRMRRLIVAAGQSVPEWTVKLRRSADFLQSLSPGQAAIVAQQAIAIASDAEDLGAEELLAEAYAELDVVPEGERLTYISRQIILIRRQHFPGPPDES
jgi:hypothetical protein